MRTHDHHEEPASRVTSFQPAPSRPSTATATTAEDVLALQRSAGNAAVTGLVGRSPVLDVLGSGGDSGLAGDRLGRILSAGGYSKSPSVFCAKLLAQVRKTGSISEELLAPIIRSGCFDDAAEAEKGFSEIIPCLAAEKAAVAGAPLVNATVRAVGDGLRKLYAVAPASSHRPAVVVAVSRPKLFQQYERAVNDRLPGIVDDVILAQRSTPTRARLGQLRVEFVRLCRSVAREEPLTDEQEGKANSLLREARVLARKDFKNVVGSLWRRVRDSKLNPELVQMEKDLRASGDVSQRRSGALQVKVSKRSKGGEIEVDFWYESMNIEHIVRLSDDPWQYNARANLIVTDAEQNQKWLEALRGKGGIWPSGEVEAFVVRHQLNDQSINFAPIGG